MDIRNLFRKSTAKAKASNKAKQPQKAVKKEDKPIVIDDSEEDEPVPRKRRSGAGRPASRQPSQPESDSSDDEPVVRRRKRASRSLAEVDGQDGAEDEEAPAPKPPVQCRSSPRKKQPVRAPVSSTRKKKTPPKTLDPSAFFGAMKAKPTKAAKRKTAAQTEDEDRRLAEELQKQEEAEQREKEDRAFAQAVQAQERINSAAKAKKASAKEGSPVKRKASKPSRADTIVLEGSDEEFQAPTTKKAKKAPSVKQEEHASPSKKRKQPKPAPTSSAKTSPSKKAKKVSAKQEPAPAEEHASPTKKRKQPAEPVKKKQSWYARKAQMENRGPPPMKGQKEIPEGKPNCLGGITIVITGQLESLERDEAKDLVMKYGGRVTGSVSGKTTYLLAGTEAGESKLSAAKAKGCEVIDEDKLFELIRSRPAQAEPKAKKKPTPKKASGKAIATKTVSPGAIMRSGSQTAHSLDEMLWVDKHRPQRMNDLIGNNSAAKQISNFLSNWPLQVKGREVKALLINGPPGIGKTSASHLIARNLGLDVKEFNASDTRNKKQLMHILGTLTGNRSVSEFFGTNKSPAPTGKSKLCVIMDEVDGIAGNADRGGLPQLVQAIKTTQVPIICICNDASTPKMRTLKNYTHNIVFRRPQAASMVGRIQEICQQEGLNIDRPALLKLCESVGGDIRQVLNTLQMWRATTDNLSFDDVKSRLVGTGKDFTQSPFSVAPSFFHSFTPGSNWINDRIDNYFVDADLMPLFVQDMYLSSVRSVDGMADAALSISHGDLISNSIRKDGNWNLMPVHACLSCVLPGALACGGGAFPRFPAWLGRNSTRNKNRRLLTSLQINLMRDIHGNSKDFTLDYLEPLKRSLIQPLISHGKDAVAETVGLLEAYGLTREDWSTLSEIGQCFSPELDPKKVDSKTKAAFTRAYNSSHHMLKVARDAKKAKKAKKGSSKVERMVAPEDPDEEEPDEEEGEDNDSTTGGDAMVKKKKLRGKGRSKAASSKPKAKKARGSKKK